MQFSDEFAFPKIETPKETFYFNFQNTVSNIKEENNHFGFSHEQNPFEIKLDEMNSKIQIHILKVILHQVF